MFLGVKLKGWYKVNIYRNTVRSTFHYYCKRISKFKEKDQHLFREENDLEFN